MPVSCTPPVSACFQMALIKSGDMLSDCLKARSFFLMLIASARTIGDAAMAGGALAVVGYGSPFVLVPSVDVPAALSDTAPTLEAGILIDDHPEF